MVDRRVIIDLIRELAPRIEKHGLVIFVGAGASATAGIPSISQLLKRLGQEMPGCMSLRDAVSRYGEQRVARALTIAVDNGSPSEEVHRQICALPCSAILTTNFDVMLENACRSIGKRAAVALTPWDIQLDTKRGDSDVVIVHLHGTFAAPSSLEFDDDASPVSNIKGRLLSGIGDSFSAGVLLFIGFDPGGRDLQLILDGLPARGTRPDLRVLLCSPAHRHRASRVESAIDRIVRLSDSESNHFLEQLRHSVPAGNVGAAAKRPIEAALMQYRRILQNAARFCQTVEPARQVDARNLRFGVNVTRTTGQARIGLGGASCSESSWEERLWDASELLANLKSVKRAMVVGEPGSGKSTLLRSCVSFLASSCNPDQILPIAISANEIGRLGEISPRSLLDIAARTTFIDGLPEAIDRKLNEGKSLLVIDGLDELPRERLENLTQALRQLSIQHPSLTYICSCRPFGFEEFISAESDCIVNLRPLSDVQIVEVISHWFAAQKDGSDLWEAIQRNPDSMALARRPLFLTMIAKDWTRRRTTPVSVVQLYEQAVELLLGTWDYQRGVFRQNAYGAAVKKRILALLALGLFRSGTSSASLVDAATACADDSVQAVRSLDDLARVLDELERNSGILYRAGLDEVSFFHHSFAEYFCSMAIKDEPADHVAEWILRSGDIIRWIPVLALDASRMSVLAGRRRISKILGGFSATGSKAEIERIASRLRNAFGIGMQESEKDRDEPTTSEPDTKS